MKGLRHRIIESLSHSDTEHASSLTSRRVLELLLGIPVLPSEAARPSTARFSRRIETLRPNRHRFSPSKAAKRRADMPHARASLRIFAISICSALLLSSGAALARDWEGSLKEEFHHTYPISANGRVELDNINGSVHISAWDRNEVQVDAVKSANSQERLQEAKIEVESSANILSITTK